MIVADTGKRKKTLEDPANKIAKKVAKTGRTSTLEPMNPYERRIIHSSVANVEGVTSRSQGEDPYRKVIIRSTNKKPRYNKDNRDRRAEENHVRKSNPVMFL